MELKFYFCEHCSNLIVKVQDQGVPVQCCGQKMTELIPGTTDASVEKHVPVCQTEDNHVSVCVGSVEHPMVENHHIAWIALQTTQGFQIKYLKPDEKPATCFALSDGDAIEAVYAYCNLHGLWKA